MGLDIENEALGAEYEQIKKVLFILQNITDSTVYRNWIQNITIISRDPDFEGGSGNPTTPISIGNQLIFLCKTINISLNFQWYISKPHAC